MRAVVEVVDATEATEPARLERDRREDAEPNRLRLGRPKGC